MNKDTCPICNKKLKAGEKLIAEYYSPQDWWTVYHLIPQEGSTWCLMGEGSVLEHKGMKSWCGQAGFQFDNTLKP